MAAVLPAGPPALSLVMGGMSVFSAVLGKLSENASLRSFHPTAFVCKVIGITSLARYQNLRDLPSKGQLL